MNNNGWRAVVRPSDFGMTDEVLIASNLSEKMMFLTEISSTGPTAESVEPGVRAPEHAWLVFPSGALQAIAEAVKPGPGGAEVQRLEEALKYERKRVDDLLATIAGLLGRS